MKKKLILIGGGGHCKSCIEIIEQLNEYSIIGILDKTTLKNTKVLEYEIIGDDKEIKYFANKGYYFLITIGQIESPKIRKRIFNQLEKYKANIATIISPRAYVSRHSKIEIGSIVMHDVLINADVSIGKNCIINSKALIEHDSVIEDHCHISTNAVINGNTTIKQESFFGSNATSRHGVIIPANSFVKAGTVFLG